MQTTIIREKLHQFIDRIEDRKVEAIYTLLMEEIDPDLLRENLIRIEREKYFRGEGRSYTWDEVRQLAGNKENRHALCKQ